MPHNNAIVIVIDRLGAGYLGPYGNTWVDTPAFNRFASQSLLWEQMISTAPTLAQTYYSIATGRHPLSANAGSAMNLWQQLQQAGVQTTLLTDEVDVRELPEISAFGERIDWPADEIERSAAAPDETNLARMFMSAMEILEQSQSPFCLWLHARGMQSPWDAPYPFREALADEEDPTPPDFVAPPDRWLGADPNPDELLGISQAYASQIVLVDMCLEMLLDHLQQRSLLDSTLVILSAPRGYPLGERGYVGPSGDDLHEELVHVPLLVRRPDQNHAMIRCQTLVQPADLYAALADWFQLHSQSAPAVTLLVPPDEIVASRRTCVVSALGDARSIRTPAWLLVQSPNKPAALYAKPDDRWEVNEVATRCTDIVEGLSDALHKYEALAHENRLDEFPELPEQLVKRLD